jgi:hypothetical protein
MIDSPRLVPYASGSGAVPESDADRPYDVATEIVPPVGSRSLTPTVQPSLRMVTVSPGAPACADIGGVAELSWR